MGPGLSHGPHRVRTSITIKARFYGFSPFKKGIQNLRIRLFGFFFFLFPFFLRKLFGLFLVLQINWISFVLASNKVLIKVILVIISGLSWT